MPQMGCHHMAQEITLEERPISHLLHMEGGRREETMIISSMLMVGVEAMTPFTNEQHTSADFTKNHASRARTKHNKASLKIE